MQDDLSYPLSAQSLPVPFYVVLEGRIVYANAAGVCMVRALSVDQLLGEPFSRFFLDAPESLQLDAAHMQERPQPPWPPRPTSRERSSPCPTRSREHLPLSA